ncbi:hypothetical protein P7C71_g4902, partial [Lecanoromycetidae sp. Uapishka_2]
MMRPTTSLILAFLATLPAGLAHPQWGNYHHRVAAQHPTSVQAPIATTTEGSTETSSTPNSSSGSEETTSTTTTTSSNGGSALAGVLYDTGDVGTANSLSPAWTCDWDSVPLGDSTGFVPQEWGPGPDHLLTQEEADISDYAMFYNEPNNCGGGGSCVTPTQTISDFGSFKTNITGKKLSTPCYANGGSDLMDSFLDTWSGSVDVACFHFYGKNDLAGLKSAVEAFAAVQQKHGISELWLSEFGDYDNPTDISQYTDYLASAVNRWAYNINYLGAGGTI